MIPPDRNVLTAALLLTAIATQVEQARRHLTVELHHCDGLPTATTGADNDGSRGQRTIRVPITLPDGNIAHVDGATVYDNVPVTSVEAAAIQRQHITDRRNDLNALTRGVVTMANELARTCRDILGMRVEVPRCTATGRDGAIEWADPTCTSVPSRGALCDRCSKAEFRWRAARGLPARTDGLFSGDAA